MPNTFHLDGLVLTEAQHDALTADGITAPNAVQQQAVPGILADGNVLIHSGTGTGKTLAYVLPLLQRLREQPGLAVIFAPFRNYSVMHPFRRPKLILPSTTPV